MIKSILLSALYSSLKAYIGSGFYNRLALEVIGLMSVTSLTGSEKMAKVLAFAQREAVTLSEFLVRAAVELILYREQGAS